jgi:hypothetical protein
MNIVQIPPDLLETNAKITAAATAAGDTLANFLSGPSAAPPVAQAPLSGTLYNGCNKVTANITPGVTGTIEVSFDITVLSISAHTFQKFRTALVKMWKGRPKEKEIAEAAGIVIPPPPEPSSRMAGYAAQLFAELAFDGDVITHGSRAFDGGNGSDDCREMLSIIRLLEVSQIKFSGTLTASSGSPATQSAAAYVPITSVAFADGLTIPFSGYSDNVLIDYEGRQKLSIPNTFWAETS